MTYVAFLRGINVTGRNRILMAELRAMFEALGFGGAQTLLQSGNVLFSCNAQAARALEARLEAETAKRLGVTTPYVVRSAKELAAFAAANPFVREAKDDPAHVIGWFVKGAIAARNVEALRAAIKGPEYVAFGKRDGYMVYPSGMGTSKLTPAVVDAKLGVQGTGRNWNTVLKLLAMTETV
jgi:uncharacterized protein (DUF1697 family)